MNIYDAKVIIILYIYNMYSEIIIGYLGLYETDIFTNYFNIEKKNISKYARTYNLKKLLYE